MPSNSLKIIKEKQKKRRELLAKQLGVGSADQLHVALNSKTENSEIKRTIDRHKGGPEKRIKLEHTTSKDKSKDLNKKKAQDSDDKLKNDDEDTLYKDSSTFLKGTQSLNPHNDYCQNYVDTGQRPQNYIRDVGLADRFEEYPKLKDLIRLKNELIRKTNIPPMYLKCDLDTFDLRDLGSKFEVILIEPPLEEYRRQGHLSSDYKCFSWEDVMSLEIEEIAATRSFVFLWCGSSDGLDFGRQCLRKWGFRRCEDICWIKTNLKQRNANMPRMEQGSLFARSKEHCLMGIKGTVRRSTDGDFIHANVDLDLIIEEEPEHGNTEKPEEIFHIIEHFCLSRRRLHMFGRDSSLRPGWLTIGPDLTNSNYNTETYANFFISNEDDVDGTLTGCTEEISRLRPKTPPPRDNKKLVHTTSGRGGGAMGSGRRPDNYQNLHANNKDSNFDSYNNQGNNNWKNNRNRVNKSWDRQPINYKR